MFTNHYSSNHKLIDSKIKNFFLVVVFLLSRVTVEAQCAMCRAVLGSENNKIKAEAVNDGIVYLMIIPYVLLAGIGLYIYRMRRKKSKT